MMKLKLFTQRFYRLVEKPAFKYWFYVVMTVISDGVILLAGILLAHMENDPEITNKFNLGIVAGLLIGISIMDLITVFAELLAKLINFLRYKSDCREEGK